MKKESITDRAETKLIAAVRSMLAELELGLPKELAGSQFESAGKRMERVQNAIQNCTSGKAVDELIVKDIVKAIIADTIENDKNILIELDFYGEYSTSEIKLEVLIYFYTKKYGKDALKELIAKHTMNTNTTEEADLLHALTGPKIKSIYNSENFNVGDEEMIDILTSVIFKKYKRARLNSNS